MCFIKGLVTYNVYKYKWGHRYFVINAKKTDLKVTITYTHISGEMSFLIQNNEEEPKVIEVKENGEVNLMIKHDTKLKIKVTFNAHSGSYKIIKEKVDATRIK